MSRTKSELKVPASDVLEFEAIKSKPPKPWRGLKVAIFIIAFVLLIGSGWLVYGDILHGLMISRNANVPLISAPVGPVKLRPDKPGGMQVPNRDKLVYGRIRSGNAASEMELVERLYPNQKFRYLCLGRVSAKSRIYHQLKARGSRGQNQIFCLIIQRTRFLL